MLCGLTADAFPGAQSEAKQGGRICLVGNDCPHPGADGKEEVGGAALHCGLAEGRCARGQPAWAAAQGPARGGAARQGPGPGALAQASLAGQQQCDVKHNAAL